MMDDGTLSLFPTRRPRRKQFLARITVDGHALGTVSSIDERTSAMRAHGVTYADLTAVLAGRVHLRRFLCGGRVVICGLPAPVRSRRRAA